MPRGPGMNPAAVALAKARVAQRQISDQLGYRSPQTISAQFAGINPPHPDLIPAIRTVAGQDTADEIAGILGVEVSA